MNAGEAGRTGQTRRWGCIFDQRREPLRRMAMMMVVGMSRTKRKLGNRQGDLGLRAVLVLETPRQPLAPEAASQPLTLPSEEQEGASRSRLGTKSQ